MACTPPTLPAAPPATAASRPHGGRRSALLGIERRHLAAFLAVVRTRSFAAVAGEIGCSRSALSQLVAHLEDACGRRLLLRRSGSAVVTPTAAGVLMGEHAAGILDAFTAARADLDRHAERRLRIAVLAGLAPRLLPALLAGLRQQPPQVLEVAGDAELAELVASGAAELALGGPPPTGPFGVRRIAREPRVLAVPGSWLVAREPGGRASLVAFAPLVDSGEEDVRRELRARGIEPRWVARADGDAGALAMVRAGVGAAVVAAGSVDSRDRRLATVALDGLLAPRVVTAYVHRDRRAAGVEHAVALARAALAPAVPAERVA